MEYMLTAVDSNGSTGIKTQPAGNYLVISAYCSGKQARSSGKHVLAKARRLSGFMGILLLFLPALSFAQIRFENPLVLNTVNGLPSDRLTRIAEDEQGFAWIGTINGLVRFDGISLETFLPGDEDSTTINNAYIIDIFPDAVNRKVWIATTTGLSAFDTEKKIFKNYRHDPDDPHSIPDHQAYRIMKDRAGILWIGFRDGGILKYRPETDDFERWLCPADRRQDNAPACTIAVHDIQEDPANDSIFWLGCRYGLLRFNKFTGAYEEFYYEMPDKKKEDYANSIRCVLPHPNGKVYFGTWWYGVFVFDTRTRTFSPLDPCFENGAGSLGRDVTNSFYPKSAHEFWINSVRGLQLYNTQTGCITQSFQNKEKEWYSIEHIDAAGRIWSASHTDGFRIFNPLMQQFAFSPYEAPDYLYACFTRKMVEDTLRGKLYIASEQSRGLYIFDLKTGAWTCIPPPPDYNLKEQGGFLAHDLAFLKNGELLIVENDHLYWYKPGFPHLKRYPIQPNHENPRLRNIVRDRKGNYWISGFHAGILRLDVAEQRIFSYQKELEEIWEVELGGDKLAVDKNDNIWLREHNGLLIYDQAAGRFIYHPYDAADVRAFRSMGGIEPDEQGRIWIATYREYLGYAHADSLERGIIRLIGKKDGLLGDGVYLVKRHQNKLLVFTDKFMQVFNPDTWQFEKQYDAGYGLGGSVNSATQRSTGEWVVGRRKNIAQFKLDSLRTNEEMPRPYISSFKVFDKPWQLTNDLSRADTIFLSPRQNFFSFEFSALGYNLPWETQFRYQLEGFDEDWQDGTKRRFAAYTNVPGGDYRFMVQAINSEGLAQGAPSVTYLHISTVWWKTIWFWGLAVLALSGLAFFVHRYRIAQVRKEERLKSDYEHKLADVEMGALRAQMNPHFIFNSLNSIEYYIIQNEPERAADYLSRFSRLIRLILQNSQSKTVPLKDELEALTLYIEMERMRFDDLFDFEVNMQEDLEIEDISVPPMLLQPYVENAIWHGLMQKKGKHGKLGLRLDSNNGHLVCLIEDNGIGREAARQLRSKSAIQRKSYGMKITSDRLAMLNKLAAANASVQVFDLKHPDGSAAGTRVELVIPLN